DVRAVGRERHGLFRCGAFAAARPRRPSIQYSGVVLPPGPNSWPLNIPAGRPVPPILRLDQHFAQECDAFATYRGVSVLARSRICACITAVRIPLRTILAAIFGLLRPKVGERGARRCRPVTRQRRQGGNGGDLVHIGVRSICAGVAALTIGFAAESVGRRVVGAPSAGQRTESALFSVFETIRPKSLDHRASLVRVASLETEFAFEPAVEESEPPASTSRHASFGERFLFDQKLGSFDERFAGADISVAETEDGESNVLKYAHLPSPGPGEHAIAQPATGRSTPKLTPAALSPPASAARKRVATAEASKDSISPAHDDSRTAIYDIAARTVYLPSGRRLEAHSGLGDHMDDARYVNLKRQGPSPPNTYKLVMREEPFHGVRAIRLVPVGDGKMFGRDGLLAHSYMLGPNGQSNGCV